MHEFYRLFYFCFSCCSFSNQFQTVIPFTSDLERDSLKVSEALEVLFSLPPSVAFEVLTFLESPSKLRLVSKSIKHHYDWIYARLLEDCLDNSITNIAAFVDSSKLKIKLARRLYPLFKKHFIGSVTARDASTFRSSVWDPLTAASTMNSEKTLTFRQNLPDTRLGTLDAIIDLLHSRLPEGRTDLLFFLDFLIFCSHTWFPRSQRVLIELLYKQQADVIITYKVMRVLKIKTISSLKFHQYPADLQQMLSEIETFHLNKKVISTISRQRMSKPLFGIQSGSSDLDHSFFKDDDRLVI